MASAYPSSPRQMTSIMLILTKRHHSHTALKRAKHHPLAHKGYIRPLVDASVVVEESDGVVTRKTKSVVGAGADRGVVAGAGEEEGDGDAEGELKNGFREKREVELFRVVDGCFGGGTCSPFSVAS